MKFDTFAMVDWSGGNDTGTKPRKDAIWLAIVRDGVVGEPEYLRNRCVAEARIAAVVQTEIEARRRICVGFDFPFGYPKGFAAALTGPPDPFAVWEWLEQRVEDAPKANNRFDLAAEINSKMGGNGPFWGNALGRDIVGLARTKDGYRNPFPDRREVERYAKGSFTCWQLAGAGAVGSQVLMGLPVLQRLRRKFSKHISVWPFEPLRTPVAFVEIWPSLFVTQAPGDMIKDAWQVQCVATTMAALGPGDLERLLDVSAPEEGWIFGVGHEAMLRSKGIQPPPLRNDCFALPAGVEWTPVDDALALLKSRLSPVTSIHKCALQDGLDEVLAEPVVAARSNPPTANSAVDGYGMAGPVKDGAHILPLVDGRAAAGVPFRGVVPKGSAIRILTGAALPSGVDTVVLQEDVTVGVQEIALNGPLKLGANARKAGEDVLQADTVLPVGRRLTPADLALLAAVGIAEVNVRQKLRVAVLSTGDELVEAGALAGPSQIYDANRPMLLGMMKKLGYQPVDLGRSPDSREALKDRLDAAAAQSDVILTSGGASAGDEDHVSALLKEAGAMSLWRIAIKPGRPLALGMWNDTPVFGLPGNPVAAMVCTLIFARPAMALLAGEGWQMPQGYLVEAAFEKNKKHGRREYLRARIREGKAQVFASEGSGRISGLSWAEGLVELEDGGRQIQPGDPVRFIPFSSFGL